MFRKQGVKVRNEESENEEVTSAKSDNSEKVKKWKHVSNMY
jgi:hypothetical protein